MAEWISVKDRLPVDTDRVLVFSTQGGRSIAVFRLTPGNPSHKYIFEGDFRPYVPWDGQLVSHWMPLPEPPAPCQPR